MQQHIRHCNAHRHWSALECQTHNHINSACLSNAVRSEEAFKLKDEYHAFRARTAQMLIVASGTLLLLIERSLRLSVRGHHASERLASKSFTPIIMVGVQVRAANVSLLHPCCTPP